MKLLLALFGEGRELGVLQMSMRALVVFFVTLLLIRIAGRRSFGLRAPFDYVVAILLGAVLSRVVVGASPVLPTCAACLVMVILHRALAWACVRSRALERLAVGVEREVYCDGVFDDKAMSAALVTATDVYQSVRQKTGARDLADVDAVILERNGRLSVIRKGGKSV